MGDRRQRKRDRPTPKSQGSEIAGVFADLRLRPDDFKIEFGGGKSFLSGQRIVWINLTHVHTGRKVSGKRKTTKKRAERETITLLKSLLESLSQGLGR